MVLELPSAPPLHDRDAIAGFYRDMFGRVRENLTMHSIIVDDNGLALDATARFTAHADAPDFPVGPLAAGESYEGRVFVHYRLRSGRIARIDVARRGPMAGPLPAPELS